MSKRIGLVSVSFLVLILCASLLSLSQAETKPTGESPLVKQGERLLALRQKLVAIQVRLALMPRNPKVAECLNKVGGIVGHAANIVYYESQLLTMIPHLKDEHKLTLSNLRIKGLSYSRKILNLQLSRLKPYYEDESCKNALAAVSDPRPIIKESLSIFDGAEGELSSLVKSNKE